MAAGPTYIQLTSIYNGGYIVLAYCVSVVGAWTTIELLLRRTGGAGKWNALLLVGAGIAFGSTATFGMHFVSPLSQPPPHTTSLISAGRGGVDDPCTSPLKSLSPSALQVGNQAVRP